MEKRLVGIEELSQYLGIKQNTLRSWVWQKRIPYHKLGRLVKFDLVEIDKWLLERKVEVFAINTGLYKR